MLNGVAPLATWIADRIAARNAVAESYFAHAAPEIARAAQAVAARLARGGTIYAFGRGAYATDAAHVAVEFVHPVIVGKRALPALDVSHAPEALVAVLVRPDDVVMAFGPPGGDPALEPAIAAARQVGALSIGLPAAGAEIAFASPCADEHVHQELFEILGHTLYESVHVFLERPALGHDVGAAAFLYPYLGSTNAVDDELLDGVSASIGMKVADGIRQRRDVAERESATIAAAVETLLVRLRRGARLLCFGNGGSATDATDFALDCVRPPAPLAPLPAVSLAETASVLTALGNDVGFELTFARQIIAHGRAADAVVAFSTSGGSKNVVAGLQEARRRGLASVALLGYDGGEIARTGLADHAIVVRCTDIPRIQETQAAIYHVLREALGLARDDA